jgi:2',3'-cyclic-nucleotide 2'-phosphodiesterase (5'-nucleotidase family)
MAKLKKYNGLLGHFVLFLTFIFLFSCQPKKLWVNKIDGKEIKLLAEYKEDSLIKGMVAPYKDSIDRDLSIPLAYAPETLDKTGEWNTSIGNFFADVTIQKGNVLLHEKHQKSIDFILLNNGGIRTIIPKGTVTARSAYELMPFENNLSVITLKGEQVLELLNYFITEHKPHPISGIQFTISKDKKPVFIKIQGIDFDPAKNYVIGTNDYLANGGDNMIFFKKGLERIDLNYKLRDILIEYFKTVDSLPVPKDQRIFIEK